jgi:predicted 3-demethylubiquinone-9 3-methyltransferase (glyoxalase superfamily)
MPTKIKKRITPFLWFDHQAEEAVKFYTSIFKNSKILKTTRYGREASSSSGQPEGSVMTVSFRLDGQDFVALNGGAYFQLTGAISFVVNCESQAEVDYYWEKLSEGGDPTAQQCGWLKDKFGVTWQVVPTVLDELLSNPDSDKARRSMNALLQMKKLNVEKLEKGAD